MEEVKGMDRRNFLKGVGAAALTAGFIGTGGARALAGTQGPPKWAHSRQNILPQTLQPFPTIKGWRGTEGFWEKVRHTFVLSDDYIHMNTGTTGSQPLFSLINLAVYNVYKSMDPRDWQTNLNNDFPDLFPVDNGILGVSAFTPRQTAVAAQYNANPDEIVLSYNTTDACNLVFAGTPWNPGDRIITTHWEHPALEGPIAWAHDYHGVDVQLVELPSNFTSSITVPYVLSLFETQLSQPLPAGAKQYIAFSEIFYKNGLRMPVQQLCQLAKSYGAYSIVDTAHGWGQLPIDCHGYGADFIAGAGHKWLCGGPGTGIFYVRNSGDNLPPFAMGNFMLYANGDLPNKTSANYNTRNWAFGGPNLYVQIRGENNTPGLYAMTDTAAYWNYLGVQDIYHRGVALGNYLKAKIASHWGPNALWVQKNDDPAFATAMTSFNPFAGKDDSSQFDTLNTAMNSVLDTLAGGDPKIYLRTTTWHDRAADPADNRVGFRVSTHGVYNNYDQIDYMFERLVAAVNATGLPQLS
jgi:selenocysteine lyase/cysteine desulfurase